MDFRMTEGMVCNGMRSGVGRKVKTRQSISLGKEVKEEEAECRMHEF
jgi:hypothetical protein